MQCSCKTNIGPSVIEDDLIVLHVRPHIIELPELTGTYLTSDAGIKRQTECKYAHVANVLE